MTRYAKTALMACVALLSACEKNAVQAIDGPVASARVRFFNFGVNAPGVNFYAGDRKVTAITSTTGTESTSGTAYGVAGSAGLYSAVDPGTYTLTSRIAAATDKDLVIASVQTALADGKAYSYYVSGFYDAATKKSDAFVVEDDIPGVDFSQAFVRFVNASSNSQPMTLYAKNTVTLEEKAIGGAVAYKAAGTFVPVTNATYDLSTRTAGSSTNAIVRTGVSFIAGRVYTISARGDMTVSSTTATTRPILDNTANR